MSAFILKVIALISMTCDHSSYLIFGRFSFLNYIGRIAFPIFAFQISEGYVHTNNLKKYFLRLFVFALISQVPFMLFTSTYTNNIHLNIFFTLTLGLLAITVYDKFSKLDYKSNYIHYLYKLLGLLFALLICFMSNLLKCDYGFFGAIVIFLFFLFRKYRILMNISFVISVISYYFNNIIHSGLFQEYILITLSTLFSLVFINLYNNEKGKNTKYFLYIFYPAHLLVLYLLHFLPIFPIL